MKFEWDENKNRSNLEKHGISFEEASLIFEGTVLTRIDDRREYGEAREISIGEIAEEVVIVVVHTKRNKKTRIISARKANRKERGRYYGHIQRKA